MHAPTEPAMRARKVNWMGSGAMVSEPTFPESLDCCVKPVQRPELSDALDRGHHHAPPVRPLASHSPYVDPGLLRELYIATGPRLGMRPADLKTLLSNASSDPRVDIVQALALDPVGPVLERNRLRHRWPLFRGVRRRLRFRTQSPERLTARWQRWVGKGGRLQNGEGRRHGLGDGLGNNVGHQLGNERMVRRGPLRQGTLRNRRRVRQWSTGNDLLREPQLLLAIVLDILGQIRERLVVAPEPPMLGVALQVGDRREGRRVLRVDGLEQVDDVILAVSPDGPNDDVPVHGGQRPTPSTLGLVVLLHLLPAVDWGDLAVCHLALLALGLRQRLQRPLPFELPSQVGPSNLRENLRAAHVISSPSPNISAIWSWYRWSITNPSCDPPRSGCPMRTASRYACLSASGVTDQSNPSRSSATSPPCSANSAIRMGRDGSF